MDEEDGERLQWNSAVRKKARLPLAPAHRNLEGAMLSDTNQTSRVRLRLSAKPAEVELIVGRRKRGRQRMRWLDGITDSMDVESE